MFRLSLTFIILRQSRRSRRPECSTAPHDQNVGADRPSAKGSLVFPKIGASDTRTTPIMLTPTFAATVERFRQWGTNIDFMIEAKQKDKALLRLMDELSSIRGVKRIGAVRRNGSHKCAKIGLRLVSFGNLGYIRQQSMEEKDHEKYQVSESSRTGLYFKKFDSSL